VEQKLLTKPEHLSVHSKFLLGFVLLDLYFYVYVLWNPVISCVKYLKNENSPVVH
jgi:hypothetical protein